MVSAPWVVSGIPQWGVLAALITIQYLCTLRAEALEGSKGLCSQCSIYVNDLPNVCQHYSTQCYTKHLLSLTVNYSTRARVLENVLIPIYNGSAAGVSIIAWCLIPIRRNWWLLKGDFQGPLYYKSSRKTELAQFPRSRQFRYIGILSEVSVTIVVC